MNADRDVRLGEPERRMPDLVSTAARAEAGRARDDSIRRVRRMTNWTAAIMIAGAGATTVALASQAMPTTTSPTGSAYTVPGTQAHGASAPHVGGAVVTSGGSGAVATTTHLANGSPAVTPLRSGSPVGNN
jgi:hypothetical protein